MAGLTIGRVCSSKTNGAVCGKSADKTWFVTGTARGTFASGIVESNGSIDANSASSATRRECSGLTRLAFGVEIVWLVTAITRDALGCSLGARNGSLRAELACSSIG